MVSTAGGGFGNGVGHKRPLSGVDHLDLDFPHIVSVSFILVLVHFSEKYHVF